MSKCKRIQTFRAAYSDEFNFIKKSTKGNEFALCILCNCDVRISHGGRSDILQHAATSKHLLAFKKTSSNAKISEFMAPDSDNQTIKAELLFTSFILEHNIPFAAADHMSRLLQSMFPNSTEVKKYACGRTKTGYLAKEIAKQATTRICDSLKTTPFSIATDGSNDAADNQMYPIVVTYFDEDAKQVKNFLFSLPILNLECSGKNIADLIINEFKLYDIPWENCLALSCDNANVMIGSKNGVFSHLKIKQPNLAVCGCICHLINLAAEKGARTLPISFDDFLVDIFYYFKRSGKRKIAFKRFQNMFGDNEKSILKHCVTRWLSLGKCLTRVLENWRSLLLFFKDECDYNKVGFQPRLDAYTIPKLPLSVQQEAKQNEPTSCASLKPIKRAKSAMSASLVPVPKKKHKSESSSCVKSSSSTDGKRLLQREERIFLSLSSNLDHALGFFLKNAISVYDKYNVIFQSDEPKIHKLRSELSNFFSELLIRFVKLSVISNCDSVFSVKFDVTANQKDNHDLVIGSETKEFVKELSENELVQFYSSVRKFFTTSCKYIVSNFPHDSDLLRYAEIADITKCKKFDFSAVRYFVDKYPCLLFRKNDEMQFDALDALEGEFLNFQLTEIPSDIVAKRGDEQWVTILQEKDHLGKNKFERLAKLMLGILSIPHSNAGCERIFSIVRRNKTDFRSSMKPETLQAVLIAKSHQTGPCYTQTFDKQFLKKAKSCTHASLS